MIKIEVYNCDDKKMFEEIKRRIQFNFLILWALNPQGRSDIRVDIKNIKSFPSAPDMEQGISICVWSDNEIEAKQARLVMSALNTLEER